MVLMKSLDLKIRQLNHQRIDQMRLFKLWLSNFIFARFNKFVGENQNSDILVLRLDDKLGDSITATGFLRELKMKHNNSQLIVVAGINTMNIYKNLDFIDEVYVSKKGLWNTLKLYFHLRKINFKYIINTSHILNPRVIFLVSVLSAYRKISFENRQAKIFSDHLNIDFKKEHVTDRYRNIFKLLGLESDVRLDYQITLNEKDLYSAQLYINELKKTCKYVVALNSFAGGKLRNLNYKTTAQIVEKLLKNPDIKVLSLANKADHAILNNWITSFKQQHWLNNEQLSSLEQNMALASLCDLIITPDTSWVHIASALDKKLVAIYRQDTDLSEINSVIWAPYSSQNKVIFAPSLPNHVDDINTVNVDDVVSAALKLLI